MWLVGRHASAVAQYSDVFSPGIDPTFHPTCLLRTPNRSTLVFPTNNQETDYDFNSERVQESLCSLE